MLRKPFSVIFVILICLTLTSVVFADEPMDKKLNFVDYMLPLHDYTLPNGLRVILAEDHSAPVVAVNITYHVGGANDPANRSGFAHLFEHMMFNGSKNVPDDTYHAYLEGVGANNNAYTVNDKTVYWEVLPANQLPLALWLESDRMASLAVTQASFDNERQVVIEEYNQRVANKAYGQSNLRLFTLPMQGYAPYERAVIGSVADLNAATLKEVQTFFNTYYVPNNATLVIVGDIDPKLTETLVQAYFADVPAGKPITPILAQYPLPDTFPLLQTAADGCKIGYTETLTDPQVELTRLATTVVAPPRGQADYYALKLLADILGSGDSSRFEQHLVREGKVATAFAGLNDYLGAAIFYTGIFPNAGGSLDEAQKLLHQEFSAVIAQGVTAAELDRVKQQTLVSSITSFRESVQSTSEWLQDYTLTFGDPNSIAAELARYEAVTPADIQRVAKTYLCDKPMNTLITLPKGEVVTAKYPGELVKPIQVETVVTPTTEILEPLTESQLAKLPKGVISRETAPAALPLTETKLPPFERFTLDNGLEVIFVAQHEVPKVQLQLVAKGSNSSVGKEAQGAADFVADMLTKGTRSRSADTIAHLIESAGGEVQASAALEWITLSLNAPVTESRLAFNMVADLARQSTFPAKEFAVVRQQTLTFLAQDEVNPSILANRQFGKIAYGDHPYSFYATPKTINGLIREDIYDLYKHIFVPNNALLVIVGDLTLAEAKAETQRVFGSWPKVGMTNWWAYPAAQMGDSSVIYLIDRPDAEQATVQVGNRGIDAFNPDRYALQVVNTVLGSGASSRLFQNLREKHGYTYGVYSRFGQPHDVSTFRVLTEVSQEHTGEAIQEILAELKRIRTEKISEAEMTAAKGLIVGNFALAIEDPADFAGQLSSRQLMGLPVEELNSYLSTIAAVMADQARAAAAKYIVSDQPIIVVVGNAKLLKPQLEKLGQVTLVDANSLK